MNDTTEKEALARLQEIVPLSSVTQRRLKQFHSLFLRWQTVQGLVSARSRFEFWERHMLDSAQLLVHAPHFQRWVDLGSGGGFPGLVLAILLAESERGFVSLIESNKRKAAFLRHVSVELRLPTKIYAERIEAVIPQKIKEVEAISARALAPLAQLCTYAAPLIEKGAHAFFHKGKTAFKEREDTQRIFYLDSEYFESILDKEAYILHIFGLKKKA